MPKFFVSVYDRAKLHVRQSDVAKVYVYVHGGNCKVETDWQCHGKI